MRREVVLIERNIDFLRFTRAFHLFAFQIFALTRRANAVGDIIHRLGQRAEQLDQAGAREHHKRDEKQQHDDDFRAERAERRHKRDADEAAGKTEPLRCPPSV